MYISEASRLSGASARAIRLYEELGLLNIQRSGSYRTYSAADVEFIKLIKQGQSVGLQLEEMVGLKERSYDFDWEQLNQVLIQKQREIDDQITQLETQRKRLKEYQQEITTCLEELDSSP